MPSFTAVATTVTYDVDVEGADPINLRHYSTAPTYFRPARASVMFRGADLVRVVLTGPNVKKDGTDGSNVHDKSWGSFDIDKAPDWVQQLVNDMTQAASETANRGPF